MKKLLSILAATGLVTTSTTTVIACGKDKDQETPAPIINRGEIILEFIQEVNKIIYDHTIKRGKYLSVLDTYAEQNFGFLNKQNLENIEISKEGKVRFDDTEKNKLIQDFNKLMAIGELEKEINDLANKEQWSLILHNLPNKKVFGGVQLLETNEIYLSRNGKGTNNFLANIRFSYEFQVYYEKSENEPVKIPNLKNELKFLLTSFTEFHEAIQETFEKIQNEIDHSIKFSDLKSLPKGKTEFENLDDEIETYYNQENQKIRTDLPIKIKQNYFNKGDLKDSVQIQLPETGNIIKLNDWVEKYRSNSENYKEIEANSYQEFWTGIKMETPTDAWKTLRLIYRDDLSGKSGIKKIIEIIEGRNEYNHLEDDFVKKIGKILEKVKIEQIKKESITKLGTMEVNNLFAVIDGYTAEIPGSFKMFLGYSPKEAVRTDMSVKELLAENIRLGILGFQKTYGIDKDSSTTSTSIGAMKNESVYNSWSEWTKESNLEEISKEINLTKTDKLEEIRKKLLLESKQEHFEYSFAGSGKLYFVVNDVFGGHIRLGRSEKIGTQKGIYNYWFELDYFKVKINFDTAKLLFAGGSDFRYMFLMYIL